MRARVPVTRSQSIPAGFTPPGWRSVLSDDKSDAFVRAPLFIIDVEGNTQQEEEEGIGYGLERSLGGGDARLSAVGEVRSGGHNPADTLRCVPALETVLKPRAWGLCALRAHYPGGQHVSWRTSAVDCRCVPILLSVARVVLEKVYIVVFRA